VNVTTQQVDGATVVALSGELDGRSAALAHEISAALRESTEVVIDLSRVQYMSSAGLRVMLIVYRQAQCLGTQVALVGLHHHLRMVMQATGFLGFFQVADSPADAIARLRSATGGALRSEPEAR